MQQSLQLVFQYFFTAGFGVGLGLVMTVIPGVLVYRKLTNGGFRLWKR